MESQRIQLSKLVDMDKPQAVMDEVKTITLVIFPEFDFGSLNNVFKDIVDLYQGNYPGYQKCNTKYHDLKHTTDTLLATIRLIHGAVITGHDFYGNDIYLTLVTALLHDTGYVQAADDISGTGGKYTPVHIARSIEFMRKYFIEKNFSRQDFIICSDILNCTGLYRRIQYREFKSSNFEMLGKILGTGDLIGQMADQTYLKKLLFLFLEFKEGKVGDYESDLDLLEKTEEFCSISLRRLEKELGGVHTFMRYHFQKRWNINRDLYRDAIDDNISHLKSVLKNHKKNYRSFLKRG